MATMTFDFPQPLTEKYRPARIADFAGLDKVKKILTRFAANPRSISFLFIGPSGTGKTTMALALANELNAELHHVPSQECSLERLQRVCTTCAYVPMAGRNCHLVLIDEADRMSQAAQLYLLSKLDSTDPIPNTIWIFTCNDMGSLQDRFLSRTMRLDFSNYGIQADAAELLERVWKAEAPTAPAPNLARIIKEACGNVRESLMRLETELLAA